MPVLMKSAMHPGQSFEKLVAELLRQLGRRDVKTDNYFQVDSKRFLEADITFAARDGLGVVEVKHYRYSSPPSAGLFIRALHQTSQVQKALGANIAILAFSCPLTPSLREAMAEFPELEIWDANVLFELASAYPVLLRQLEQLFEVSAPVLAKPYNVFTPPDPEPDAVPKTGRLLADALKSIAPGKAAASVFEDACVAALRYLFDSDLHGWYEQSSTDDGLHRRDLVCRILPNAEVWRLMLTDFKSRYVVFEFKNYSELIAQNEIITTERYLYPCALRNVAIVISPLGCSESAKKVIRGAMREHGKLILPLKISEIEELLLGKDEGTDPNTYLFDQLDNFLMRLGR